MLIVVAETSVDVDVDVGADIVVIEAQAIA
jgi:hypothetical protein